MSPEPRLAMHRVHYDELPLRGSSRNFVGADHRETGVSVFLFNGQRRVRRSLA